MKEIKLERKTAKSKKKKLEIYRKCRQKLASSLEDWQATPAIEEERKFRVLKEKARKEKIVIELGAVKMKEIEENLRKKQTLKNSIPIVTDLVECTALEAETFDAELPADLGCDKPGTTSCNADCDQVNFFPFTKPQPLPRSTVAEAAAATKL